MSPFNNLQESTKLIRLITVIKNNGENHSTKNHPSNMSVKTTDIEKLNYQDWQEYIRQQNKSYL